MSWGQQNARFYCSVHSARKRPEIVLGSAESGLEIVAAGEHGAIELILSAQGWEEEILVAPRGGKTIKRQPYDTFKVRYAPWRSCTDRIGPSVDIAWGRLDYDKVRHGDTCVRLNDETMELYRTMRAMEIMKQR